MKVRNLAYALGMVQATLENLDDEDLRWFAARGVTVAEIDQLRQTLHRVGMAFWMIPGADTPKEKDNG